MPSHSINPQLERELAQKLADYIAAETLVVWDVDLLNDDVIRVYPCDAPGRPPLNRRSEVAEAGPAVPGWTMPVNDLFIPL